MENNRCEVGRWRDVMSNDRQRQADRSGWSSSTVLRVIVCIYNKIIKYQENIS